MRSDDVAQSVRDKINRAVTCHCDYGLCPQYDIAERMYTSEELKRIAPITAESVFRILELDYQLSPAECQWEYTFTPLERLTAVNPFTITVLKYVDVDPDEVERYIEENLIPEKDLEDLVADWRRAPKYILVEKIRSDIERVNKIISHLKHDGMYYPPVVDDSGDVIDGAHRIAAISHLYEPYQRIYYWKLHEL